MTENHPTLPRWYAPGPLLTGRLKVQPEDFLVEELPAYLPSGSGEHLFLWVEKRDLASELMLRHIARTLDIPQRDIGIAGLKDRRAITRQWISVPARAAERLSALDTDHLRVLDHKLHGNKLRTGHLTGNRFEIRAKCLGLRAERQKDETTDPLSVPQPLALDPQPILTRGFPNYYGDQRFGREGSTLELGFDLLARRQTPRDIPFARRKFLLKLALSSVQSELFNRTLAQRLQDGLLDTVLAGDVMEVVASGGKFLAEDPTVEQPRCAAYETVITGPMFGLKMRTPLGVPAEREARVLEEAGLTLDAFGGFGDLLAGTRRPFVIRPQELTITTEPDGWRFRFTLPAGVYATTLLREFGDFTDGPVTDDTQQEGPTAETES